MLETMFPMVEKHGVFKAMENLNLEVKRRSIRSIRKKMEQENQHY